VLPTTVVIAQCPAERRPVRYHSRKAPPPTPRHCAGRSPPYAS
jgi:hypothetical protein